MKITIAFNCKINQSCYVPFFKAKKIYLQANFGMPTFIEAMVTSIDDEYIKEFSITTAVTEFLMDCCHEDLRVISINGKPLKNKDGEEIIINPYSESYDLPINYGLNIMEFELIKGSDYNKKDKYNRKLLLKN